MSLRRQEKTSVNLLEELKTKSKLNSFHPECCCVKLFANLVAVKVFESTEGFRIN